MPSLSSSFEVYTKDDMQKQKDEIDGRLSKQANASEKNTSILDDSIERYGANNTLRHRRKSKTTHLHEMETNCLSRNFEIPKKVNDSRDPCDGSTILSQSLHQRVDSFRIPLPDFPVTTRTIGESVPELHYIGEISHGSNFGQNFISCKWTFEWGSSWSLLEGEFSGQSQFALSSDDGDYIWNHPLDIHFACTSLRGWPRLVLEVWELDEYNRLSLIGYGYTHLPSSVGEACLTIPCWRPYVSTENEMKDFFLGYSIPQQDSTLVYGKPWDIRHNIITIPKGQVQIRLSTISRYMTDQHVDVN